MSGMKLIIDAINIPADIQTYKLIQVYGTLQNDTILKEFETYITEGWLPNRNNVREDV